MPELPEVETIVRQLDKALKGKVISGVEVLREKSFGGSSLELMGKKIKKVGRKAKMVVIEFDKLVVLVHLKMTGQLVLVKGKERVVGGHPTADWVNKLPSKHTRVIINFKDGSRLFFNDMRTFGWMKIGDVPSMPPDVVDKEFDFNYLKSVFAKSKRAVKVIIMDQKQMGGVGNIYACDALFLAGVDPGKLANSLNGNEIKQVYKAVKKIINKGIKMGGASYSDYKDTRGMGGKYQEHFLVYAREGMNCENCDGKIKKFKLGGRGTYWCPKCQMR